MDQQDGIWIIDSQARTTYAHNRMAEILGVSPAELIGQDSWCSFSLKSIPPSSPRRFRSPGLGARHPDV